MNLKWWEWSYKEWDTASNVMVGIGLLFALFGIILFIFLSTRPCPPAPSMAAGKEEVLEYFDLVHETDNFQCQKRLNVWLTTRSEFERVMAGTH